jgi:uncharacterized protein YbjT (DUF2867 family)
MDAPILVTGGTGTLGRAVVARLQDAGWEHRVLSRRSGPGLVTGDLAAGTGVDAAVGGAGVILHLATAPRHDAATTRTLIDAALRHGRPHLVFVSIVGADRIPLAYYREKVAVERLVEESGLPWTLLRATQFHDLVAGVFGALARTGLLPVLARTSFQPIDVRDVSGRLVELAAADPGGRATDMGGPAIRSMDELARVWLRATGRRRPVLPVPLPGALARGYREGRHLAPHHPDGVITFEEFLAGRSAASRP